jgi:DNA-binding MarR family transcriptional regulator
MMAEAQPLRPEAASKARLRLWLKLLRVSRGVEGRLRERLRVDYGSTLPRFDVMATLARFPDGLRMGDLSGHLRVSGGNVTGIVDRLEAEGLVRRTAVQGDRRAFRVALTDRGRAEFADHAVAHEAWVDAMFAGLGEGEAAALSRALDVLGRRLEAAE